MINTKEKTKCRLGSNRELSPWKDDPSTSLIIPSKWTSCNAEWHKKESLLCLNTVNGRGLVFWRSSQYFMSISRLCISVPLSTSCTDFTVNSKFSANRWSYLRCFSWLKHWTKRFCADFSHCFSRSVATGFKWLRTKYTGIHLSTEWDCLFPWKFDRLCFSKASGRDSKRNRIFLQRN